MRALSCGESGGTLLGYRAPLLDGEMGTAQTVKLMRRLVDQAQADPAFVRFAVDLVRNVPAYDDYGEISALFSWVLSNIRYTKDPFSKEKLYPPQELLKIRAGDCDDMATLLGALALSLGYPARLVTVGVNPESPSDFSHVYVEVECPPASGNWVALDAARPGAQFGRQPESFTRKRSWSLTDDSYQDFKGSTRLRGLAGYLGDDSTDWGAILTQSISEIPQITAAVQGQPTVMRMPNGSVVSTGNPYSSFTTPYTPGFAAPAAGYPGVPLVSAFQSWLPWLMIGAVVFAVIKK
jgi:Transglutaminase-like superfamily